MPALRDRAGYIVVRLPGLQDLPTPSRTPGSTPDTARPPAHPQPGSPILVASPTRLLPLAARHWVTALC